MKKLRIALCGCRGHVEKFGNLINGYEESETVAVWDNVPGRGEAVAERLNCAFESDYEKLLTSYQLDGVVIVAENSLHKDMVIRAAGHGVHVFVEKPLCVNAEDAKEIQQVIHESGVHFYMTDPFVRNGAVGLKKLIEDGVLGEINGGTFHLGTGGGLKRPLDYDKEKHLGGIMADVGGHMIHQAHYLFGKPEKISATLGYYTEEARKNEFEESALVTMQYPHGRLVSLECSWFASCEVAYQMVYGTKGYARIVRDPEALEREILTYNLGNDEEVELRGDSLPTPPTRHVRYWVEMMVKNTPNEMVGVDPLSNSGVSIDNAVEFVEIIDAIYRSAKNGGAAVTL
ncbi:MAG: Gfo/Idh/MocA family oxidoreductase [Lachnospiraceae bacterium]|nr:Gfo/Idh/MocA family oxidoreductase [Lachnospiraceae bacterium]